MSSFLSTLILFCSHLHSAVKFWNLCFFSEASKPDIPQSEIESVEVLICDVDILSSNYYKMPLLKWAHCTWAGKFYFFNLFSKESHLFLINMVQYFAQ